KDIKRDEDEHIVIENHHQPIIDYRTFATTKALREKRSTSNYRGNKKYSNDYTGFLVCGDCGNPMFSMSRSDLKPAYICGNYQRRGLSACTSHHIRVDKLDELIKIYIKKLMDNSSDILEKLNEELNKETDDIVETENSADNLAEVLDSLYEELKITKRQRVRDILKHPEQEALLSETYDEMEEELQSKIKGLNHQIEMLSDKRNTIIQVNRTAKTSIEVFEDILKKEKLERNDLELLIDQIKVYENRIELKLKPDIDSILRSNVSEEKELTNEEIEALLRETLVQTAQKRKNREFSIDVICDGDPLEIFTDNDGEVIFKKYSPIGELAAFAGQYADVLYKVGGCPVIICDRDSVVTAAGVPKKEVLERRVTPMLEDLMERRAVYSRSGASGENLLFPVEGFDKAALAAAAIISAGDVCGAVIYLSDGREKASETEAKLVTAAANFLGKQMEE
ncbi:MAG: stage V sporulation protein T, partial [Ruminococcaceae bacterium]|nr:stage V sporulation protein T [Oscillospiraceae bacterium]